MCTDRMFADIQMLGAHSDVAVGRRNNHLVLVPKHADPIELGDTEIHGTALRVSVSADLTVSWVYAGTITIVYISTSHTVDAIRTVASPEPVGQIYATRAAYAYSTEHEVRHRVGDGDESVYPRSNVLALRLHDEKVYALYDDADRWGVAVYPGEVDIGLPPRCERKARRVDVGLDGFQPSPVPPDIVRSEPTMVMGENYLFVPAEPDAAITMAVSADGDIAVATSFAVFVRASDRAGWLVYKNADIVSLVFSEKHLVGAHASASICNFHTKHIYSPPYPNMRIFWYPGNTALSPSILVHPRGFMQMW